MVFSIIQSLKGQVHGVSKETDKAFDHQGTGSLTPSTDMPSASKNHTLEHQDSSYLTVSTGADSVISTSFDHLWDAIEKSRVHNSSGGLGNQNAEAEAFVDKLKAQVSCVANSIEFEEQYHERSAKLLLSAVDDNTLNGNGDPTGTLPYLRIQAEEIIQSSLRLRDFAINSKEALETIVTCADRVMGTKCKAMLLQMTSVAPWNGPNSTMVVVLSDIYDVIRSAENPTKTQSPASKWEAPSSFERSTTKYWVETHRLGDLLYSCVKEVPLLVYGNSGRLTSENAINSIESDKLWTNLSTKISSVYFDSPQMSLYKERIARHEGAQLLRARWYGEKPKGDEKVFLELKTHHEKWINVSSIKERVSIMEKQMSSFLAREPWVYQDAERIVALANPKLKDKELDEATGLLLRMHRLVLDQDLRPCVRSVYLRAAFQSPTTNALRLTLDRDVTMIDESSAPLGSWCLPEGTPIDSSMVKCMPYPIFEVKLAGSDMPESLTALISDGTIVEAAKFSKFLTGAAAFNSEKVKTLPYWAENPAFHEMLRTNRKHRADSSLSKTPSDRQPQDTAIPAVANRTGNTSVVYATEGSIQKRSPALGSFLRNLLPVRKTTPKIVAPRRPARVEPKSFFANERTFIQWSSAALWLLTVAALIVEREEDGTTYLTNAGIALCVGSIILLIHAILVYFRRIKLMQTGNPNGYVDRFGPIVLTCVVFCGVVVLLVEKTKTAVMHITRQENATVRPEQGLCFQYTNNGISSLIYQPSDVLVDQDRDMLLVPSLGHIMGHSTVSLSADVETLIDIPGADFEGLANVDGRIFALSEAINQGDPSILFELAWDDGGRLGLVQRFDLGISDSSNEGITYIPDQNGESGSLCIDRGDGRLDLFELPPPPPLGTDSVVDPASALRQLSRKDGFNSKMITNGLEDGKIASLFYFEGILYILHDNDRVIRSWEVSTGAFVSEFTLPLVSEGEAFAQQWEGFAIERNTAGNFGGSGSDTAMRLRGSTAQQRQE